ncbi:hypothetical protein Pelo_154 [Pelomyxa schiedti]|nr:hypothetical protein Pelo_154 [Pelomyxa schiedti]
MSTSLSDEVPIIMQLPCSPNANAVPKPPTGSSPGTATTPTTTTPSPAPSPVAQSEGGGGSAAQQQRGPGGGGAPATSGKAEPEWVMTQKKVFTKWMNAHVSRDPGGANNSTTTGATPSPSAPGGGRTIGVPQFVPITQLEMELFNGLTLIRAAHVLFGVPLTKYTANPKNQFSYLDNISVAFRMLETAEINVTIKPMQLIDHDLKMILGLVWLLIQQYNLKKIAGGGLLTWCRDCETKRKNLEDSFAIGESELGIPPLLDVDDFFTVTTLDELSVMAYVSEFYHALGVESAPVSEPVLLPQPQVEVNKRDQWKTVQETESRNKLDELHAVQTECDQKMKDLLKRVSELEEELSMRKRELAHKSTLVSNLEQMETHLQGRISALQNELATFQLSSDQKASAIAIFRQQELDMNSKLHSLQEQLVQSKKNHENCAEILSQMEVKLVAMQEQATKFKLERNEQESMRVQQESDWRNQLSIIQDQLSKIKGDNDRQKSLLEQQDQNWKVKVSELQAQISQLKEESDKKDSMLGEWKTKYSAQQEQMVRLQSGFTEKELLLTQMERDLKVRLSAMQLELSNTRVQLDEKTAASNLLAQKEADWKSLESALQLQLQELEVSQVQKDALLNQRSTEIKQLQQQTAVLQAAVEGKEARLIQCELDCKAQLSALHEQLTFAESNMEKYKSITSQYENASENQIPFLREQLTTLQAELNKKVEFFAQKQKEWNLQLSLLQSQLAEQSALASAQQSEFKEKALSLTNENTHLKEKIKAKEAQWDIHMRELQSKLSMYEVELETKSKAIASHQKSEEDTSLKMGELSRSEASLQSQLESSLNQTQKAQSELEQMVKNVASLIDERSGLNQQLAQSEESRKEKQETINQLESQLLVLQSQMASSTQACKQMEATRAEQTNGWKLRYTHLEQQYNTLLKQVSELRNSHKHSFNVDFVRESETSIQSTTHTDSQIDSPSTDNDIQWRECAEQRKLDLERIQLENERCLSQLQAVSKSNEELSQQIATKKDSDVLAISLLETEYKSKLDRVNDNLLRTQHALEEKSTSLLASSHRLEEMQNKLSQTERTVQTLTDANEALIHKSSQRELELKEEISTLKETLQQMQLRQSSESSTEHGNGLLQPNNQNHEQLLAEQKQCMDRLSQIIQSILGSLSTLNSLEIGSTDSSEGTIGIQQKLPLTSLSDQLSQAHADLQTYTNKLAAWSVCNTGLPQLSGDSYTGSLSSKSNQSFPPNSIQPFTGSKANSEAISAFTQQLHSLLENFSRMKAQLENQTNSDLSLTKRNEQLWEQIASLWDALLKLQFRSQQIFGQLSSSLGEKSNTVQAEDELNTPNPPLEAKISKLEATLNQVQGEKEVITMNLAKAAARENELQTQQQINLETLHKYQLDKEQLSARLVSGQNREKELQNKVATLEARISTADVSPPELANVKAQLLATQSENKQQAEALQMLNKSQTGLNKQLSTIQTKLSLSQASLKQQTSRIRDLNSVVEDLRAQLAAATSEVERQRATASTFMKKEADCQLKLNHLQEQLNFANKQVSLGQQSFFQTESKLQTKISNLEAELSHLMFEIQHLRQALQFQPASVPSPPVLSPAPVNTKPVSRAPPRKSRYLEVPATPVHHRSPSPPRTTPSPHPKTTLKARTCSTSPTSRQRSEFLIPQSKLPYRLESFKASSFDPRNKKLKKVFQALLEQFQGTEENSVSIDAQTIKSVMQEQGYDLSTQQARHLLIQMDPTQTGIFWEPFHDTLADYITSHKPNYFPKLTTKPGYMS